MADFVTLWQRPVRIGLATFAVALGAILFFGARDRAPSVVADTVSRTDRNAIIESRYAQIVQREDRADNLKIEADRQLAYEDGSVRLLGSVKIEFSDGLVVDTEEALYADGGDLVSMPSLTRFGRPNMEASAESARYERNEDLLLLEPNATVVLRSDVETKLESQTKITAERALVAQVDGYMEFVGSVAITGDKQSMHAHEIRTNLTPDSSAFASLALTGDARVRGKEETPGSLELVTAPVVNVSYKDSALQNILMTGGARLELFTDGSGGQLRAMSAADISVEYLDDELSSIVLDRTANIALVGREDSPGTEITGDYIEIALGSGTNAFDQIYGKEEVSIRLPVRAGAVQTISAGSMEMTSAELQTDDSGGLQAVFKSEVEYVESEHGGTEGESAVFRRILSDELIAELDNDLIGMNAATFTGGVRVDTGDLTGLAEAVIYDVDADEVTFSGTNEQGRVPLVNDARGALLASSIRVRLGGPDIQATGSVSSVLSSDADGSDGVSDAKRPQLLSEGSPIYVTATEFAYDGAASRATYTGASRLWQNSTEFRASSLVLDEASGDVAALGSVETQILILQNGDNSDEPVQMISTGSADSFEYIDATRTATYSTNATLLTEVIDLAASTIRLVLETDGRSLQRIFAAGGVKLMLEGRQLVGETMTYYENDGRYEMTGAPVRIIEEVAVESEDSEIETTECRETTGRALTFYVNSEALLVDANSEVRTSSMNQPCPSDTPSEPPSDTPSEPSSPAVL